MIPVTSTPLDTDRQIERAIAQSVQSAPSVTKDGLSAAGFGTSTYRTAFLPPYGSRARELALRELYRADEMNLVRGAFTGVAKGIASLGWEIQGDDSIDPLYQDMARSQGWRLHNSTGVEYFQEVLRQANFGAGWGTLMTQSFNDFLRYDAGAYTEVIASGVSTDRPTGPIMGIAHLDPLRCYPTGDPLYPAVYYDRWGKMHVLHHSRVMRMIDMDDGDEMHPGYGDCALSRAVSLAIQEIWITRYITARLDDKPAPGVDIYGGISRGEWEAEQKRYRAQQSTDARPVFGQRLSYFTMDMEHLPRIDSHDFQSSPEKFDYRVYTDINVDRLALVLGVDRQELMQLMGGNIGSKGQSVILDQKSRGKTIGLFLQETERKFNDLLPEGYTFGFKPRDNQEAAAEAEKARLWTGVAKDAPLSADEKRTLLSNQVEAVRDAITNTPRGNDVDQPVIAQDNTAGAAPIAPTSEPTPSPTAPVHAASEQKEYSTTQAQFVQEVRNLLVSATSPNVYIRPDRRGFGVTMRSLLKRHGLQAYKDGLASGGVTVDTLDGDDEAAYMRVFMEQSGYINGLADDVYTKKTVTPANATDRAFLWGKSLQAFDDAGLMSADRNGMYKWVRGLTSDSCPTCLRMNGQVHRLKTYKARGIMPRSSRLACKGFQCHCQFERTTERARGRF